MLRHRWLRFAAVSVSMVVLFIAAPVEPVRLKSAGGCTGTLTTATPTTTGTTTTSSPVAGVMVDPNGVLRTQLFMDQTGQLMWQRMQAAKAQLNPKIAKQSALRKISLNRLEKALGDRLGSGEKPTDDMLHLAGLTRVQYVFFYPDTKDIVIAGPAEGWAADLSGRVRGIASGRPVVELNDLVTALRAYPANSKKETALISCSIDPTKEGLQRMQEFLQAVGSRLSAGNAQAETDQIVKGLHDSLGLQTVRITGVPANTHFAQVLVEADYRMKLIGIGLERPPIKQFVNYVDKANPGSVARNALQRWYFVPDYECVRVTDDDLAMQLVGDGVKLVGADEVVAADGSRAKAGTVDQASRAFTEGFTRKYADIASVIPVYAQLRNCIDLAVVAAFIHEQNYYKKAGWNMPVFGDEGVFPVQTLTAPQQVESAVTSVWKRNTLMTPIGGGVHIEPTEALKESNIKRDDKGTVSKARQEIDLKKLEPGQWWWD
jgi:Protein of unknown function (DUF1598)